MIAPGDNLEALIKMMKGEIEINGYQKTVILFSVLCFLIGGIVGYCLRLLSGRGQLSDLRIRAAEYQKRIGEYTAREAEFTKRFNQIQAEFAASRSAVDGYRQEVGRLRTEIKRLSKPLSKSGNKIDSAIEHAARITNSVDRIERIISTVQKRGGKKD
jgi:predicted nuclease with TOPRIM domain